MKQAAAFADKVEIAFVGLVEVACSAQLADEEEVGAESEIGKKAGDAIHEDFRLISVDDGLNRLGVFFLKCRHVCRKTNIIHII